jgi:hypothetical protein
MGSALIEVSSLVIRSFRIILIFESGHWLYNFIKILPRVWSQHNFMIVCPDHFRVLTNLRGCDDKTGHIFEADDLSVGETHCKAECVSELLRTHVSSHEDLVGNTLMSSFKFKHNYNNFKLIFSIMSPNM